MFDKNDENYIYELVSRNLKKERIKKGMTQADLAQKSNYSTQFISNIECKTYQTFSLGTIYRFARVLNIDITKLFEDDK